MQKIIYFDNASTTPVDVSVVKLISQVMKDNYGNYDSLHQLGVKSHDAVEKARKEFAKLIHAQPNQIIFTSGASESNNIAIKGAAYSSKKKTLITSAIEHSSVHETFLQLKEQGYNTIFLRVNKEGLVDIKELEDKIDEDTFLVSIIHANNEIGSIQDIKKIGEICKNKGILFHTDATQSFTKIPLDVNKLNIDLLSVSAHKFHGPKGVGALFVRDSKKLTKLLGGGSVENDLRPGTIDTPSIIGMVHAAKNQKHSKIKKIRDHIVKRILKEIPNSYLNGPKDPKNKLDNIANIRFDYVEGEAILFRLNDHGICISTGSACSSKNLKPSKVLLALGLKPEQAHGSIRISLSKYNTMKEADYFVDKLKLVIKDLKKISSIGG